MGLTIWKATIETPHSTEIEVPVGTEFLSAHAQFERICVWFRCDPQAPREKRKLAVVGTGFGAPAGGKFLGTVILRGGTLIFHVFSEN